MRLDDHLMTVLTGLVLAVLVGIMAQKSDYIIDAFSTKRAAVAEPDSFIIRAGRDQELDVLINDIGTKQGARTAPVKIVSNPTCGTVAAEGHKIRYAGSDNCSGLITFAYCLENASSCEPANVVLNVRPGQALLASAKTSASADTDIQPIRAFVVTTGEPAAEFDSEFDTLTTKSVARFLVDTDAQALDGLAQVPGNVAVVDQGPAPLDASNTAQYLHHSTSGEISGIRHAASGSSN